MHPLPPDLKIFTTGDASPTLAFERADGYVEKMHHSGGALTESLYIYHHGLTLALDQGLLPHVLSVGLGLGYNELIALAEFDRRGIHHGLVWSFEAHPYLREGFRGWLTEDAPTALHPVLDQVCAGIAAHFGIKDLRAHARRAHAEGRLQLRSECPQSTEGLVNAAVVFYDAFSNKMSPELWQEREVEAALRPLLNERAVLCTYAATGAMKRVLRNLGFRRLERPGFQGKRESTLAIRND